MMRQIANTYETPESKMSQTTSKNPYPKEFIDTQVDLLLGLISSRIPVIGMTICQTLFATPSYREILKKRLIEWYQSAHQYSFTELKNKVRATMSPDNCDFSFENLRKIVVELQNEFCRSIPELAQSEPSTVIDAFVKNQVKYYAEKWDWSYSK